MTATITIVGNLSKDPDLKYTPSGHAVAECVVVVNHRTKKDGEWVDGEAEFWDVSIWRDYAEHVAESLRKGDRIVVTGQARKRKYETKDGQTRYAVEVQADEVCPSLRWAARPAAVKSSKGGPSDGSPF